MPPILELRAKPKIEGGHYRFDVYDFEHWNEGDSKWKDFKKCQSSDKLAEERNNGNDLFGTWLKDGTYSEIRLRALTFEIDIKGMDPNISSETKRDEALNHMSYLIKTKATGMALYRQFWYRCRLKWCANYRTRLVWKYDQSDGKIYTSFELGNWYSSDNVVLEKMENDTICIVSDVYRPKFVPEYTSTLKNDCNQQYNLTGLNLAGLTLRTRSTEENFPTTLDYSILYRCVLDGVNEGTSFRGAYLKNARFCGNSNLRNCDLTSTHCQELHLDYPETTVDNNTNINIFGGICLDEASLFEEAKFTFQGSVAIPIPPNAYMYKIEGCFGRLKYFGKSRATLLKHKQELCYVVDELKRLRRYEVKRDNWQKIIASWIAFQNKSLETKEAATMRSNLFNNPDSKQLLIAGIMLYGMADEPKLKDEIANINTILEGKDRIGNLSLVVYFFFLKILSDLTSDRIKKLINEIIKVDTATTMLVGSSNEIPQDSHIPFSALVGFLGLAMVATYKVVTDYRRRHPHHTHSKQYNKLEYESLMEA